MWRYLVDACYDVWDAFCTCLSLLPGAIGVVIFCILLAGLITYLISILPGN